MLSWHHESSRPEGPLRSLFFDAVHEKERPCTTAPRIDLIDNENPKNTAFSLAPELAQH